LLQRHPQGSRAEARGAAAVLPGTARPGRAVVGQEDRAGRGCRQVMNKWRFALIGFLIAVPVIVWAAAGAYAIWRAGHGFLPGWPLFACASLSYFLAWYWLRKNRLLAPPDQGPPLHWTDRDREAWKLVEVRAEQLGGQERTEFYSLAHYGSLGQEMAVELGRFYHPNAADPLGAATVPEVLAVVELAAHDLQEMVDEAIPGSHVMTVNDWRWTRDVALKATDWYSKASYLWWAAAAVFA